MNTQFSQLLGITWYELKMHWRRRALLVITIAIIGIIFAEMLIFQGDITSFVPAFRADPAQLTAEQNVRFHTLNVVFITWGAVGAIMAKLHHPFTRSLRLSEEAEARPAPQVRRVMLRLSQPRVHTLPLNPVQA